MYTTKAKSMDIIQRVQNKLLIILQAIAWAQTFLLVCFRFNFIIALCVVDGIENPQ